MSHRTDEQLLTICARYDEGASLGVIAREMSDATGRRITRSTISGLVRRMGIVRSPGAGR